MTDNITGKTILLITEGYYNYEYAVRDTLLQLGAKEVVLKKIEYIKGTLREHLTWRNIYWCLRDPRERIKKTEKLIKEIDCYTFDVMLSLLSLKFSKYFLDYLREKNPNIKLFLFVWDTVTVQQPHYFDYYPKFDYVYCFDRDDAKKYGWKYYPDFYIGNDDDNMDLIYDISFIGTYHYVPASKNRGEIVHYVYEFCNKYNLKSYLYLRNYADNKKTSLLKSLYRKFTNRKYAKLIEKYKDYGFIHSEKLSLDEVDRVFNQSKAILDIGFTNRQGMTINCLTAIAKGKKLITTNKRVKEEPFYDPANIYIMDEDNPHLDIGFFNIPMNPVNIEYLRIDNWLKHILNDVD